MRSSDEGRAAGAAEKLAAGLRAKMVRERAAVSIAALPAPASPPPPPLLLELTGSQWTAEPSSAQSLLKAFGPGGYTTYTVRASLPDGLVLVASRRYSDFEALHAQLLPAFQTAPGLDRRGAGGAGGGVPELPPKRSLVFSSVAEVAAEREVGLLGWLEALPAGPCQQALLDNFFGAGYNRLSRHAAAMAAEGWDRLSTLLRAESSDLQELGIPARHAQMILERVQQVAPRPPTMYMAPCCVL